MHDLGEGFEALGHYEIQRKIAEGGFGVVYLAHDTRLDREVAILVGRPCVGGSEVLVDRIVDQPASLDMARLRAGARATVLAGGAQCRETEPPGHRADL